MRQYLQLLADTYYGHVKSDRTGTGTTSVFGRQLRFDLGAGFPLVTTKKIHWPSVVAELLWFIRGDTNTAFLHESGCSIWDEWANEQGELGPVYGKQWRSWPRTDALKRVMFGDHDQLFRAIHELKTNPDSRRIIVSAWNVDQLDEMALAPCHVLFQFYSRELTLSERAAKLNGNVGLIGTDANIATFLDSQGVPRRALSCQVYQRSCDVFLGVPFNIASYALLTHMVAQITDHAVGDLIWTGGDVHLYSNHVEQAQLQASREPLPLPTLKLNPAIRDIDAFTTTDIVLVDYRHHAGIKAKVAV